MNRKDRRAAAKRGQGGNVSSTASRFAAHFAQAVRHYHLGEQLAAEACCREILALDSKHAGSRHLLGMIAQQRGRFDEAAEHFRGAIAVASDPAPAYHGLGGALAAAGRLEEAASAFEQAVARKPSAAAGPVPDITESLLILGNLYTRLGRADQADKAFRRSLALNPSFSKSYNDYGAMLLAQGKPAEASIQFTRALETAPELLEEFSAVKSLLLNLNVALGEAVARAAAAWPKLVSIDELLGPDGLAAIANDPMLRCVLESSTVRDIALERFLTSVRAAVLKLAVESAETVDESVLNFCCALARQCFINEYVFADSIEELEQAEQLKRVLIGALAKDAAVPPVWVAAVASYFPLSSLISSLGDQPSAIDRSWPEAVERLLTQQIREVQQERQLQDSIPRLTAIADGASESVRRQYEENPYPRWILAPSHRAPVGVDEHLRALFPMAPFRPLGDRKGMDILVAGCGTGMHPIGMARRYKQARVLAVDLSLNSLCYAQRKTRELGLRNIEYAQADILRLGTLGRSFDIVDAGGVLHHLADPSEGWRQLMRLLRPGGLMRVGLYSALGRADVVAARRFIAERGYGPTAADIRRCRQELLTTPLHVLARYNDFFSISECRDLLFHVQEHRLSIPQIKEFLLAQNLRFIGFELSQAAVQAFRTRFPDDQTMTDLDCWNTFEAERPATFAGMYQFWCQKD